MGELGVAPGDSEIHQRKLIECFHKNEGAACNRTYLSREFYNRGFNNAVFPTCFVVVVFQKKLVFEAWIPEMSR